MVRKKPKYCTGRQDPIYTGPDKFLITRFYLGFFVWGRSPEWPKDTSSVLGGSGGMPPEIFSDEYALRCNLVHFETQLCP